MWEEGVRIYGTLGVHNNFSFFKVIFKGEKNTFTLNTKLWVMTYQSNGLLTSFSFFFFFGVGGWGGWGGVGGGR